MGKVNNHATWTEQVSCGNVQNELSRNIKKKLPRGQPLYLVMHKLFGFVLHLKMLFKFLAELINTSCSVNQLDLTGIERM